MKTNRRSFFQTIGVGTAGLGLASVIPFSTKASTRATSKYDEEEQILFIGDDFAIANTEYGKVKGFILRGITQFRGIPYGADTTGSNRFMPPKKPEPWQDVYSALWWGNTAPQLMENRYANTSSAFVNHWNYDDVSEDCLKLNVWTPAIDSKKRPVLVWLHGGGYTSGNGIEHDGYMGENLSRKGDVVFVSINHRLGPIGFSDLSGVGSEKYKSSGNVGALDMVAALEWVKENIANFGGDANNVTIMGQSGGGAKVCTVAAMPKASGLIHKAVALSGSTTSAMDQDVSRKMGEYILKEAGLKPSQIDKLQEMPWKDYILLANKAQQRFVQENGNDGMRMGFAPIADGINIPKGTFFSEENGVSSKVPMIISSTFHEWAKTRDNAKLENISVSEAKEMMKENAGLRGGFGDKASAVYEAYAKAFPNAKPIEIVILAGSNRSGVVRTATSKLKQTAPVYVAWFGWEPPLFDSRMRAFHCLDICFWFDNSDVMLTHTGGGARPRRLAGVMSDALISFMKTGDPNCYSLPQWPKFTVDKGAVMILDDVCEVKNDPDREARQMLS